MTNLLCLIGGHNHEYFSKSGQQGHKFFCKRCLRIVQVGPPRAIKPPATVDTPTGVFALSPETVPAPAAPFDFGVSSRLASAIRNELRKPNDFTMPSNGDTE